ncbi:MAG: NIPSNAP family containing protein, partial [Acidobacteria bacterium]
DRTAKWNAFRETPEWKKLSGAPRYAFESIVSNITNLILSPTTYSQI